MARASETEKAERLNRARELLQQLDQFPLPGDLAMAVRDSEIARDESTQAAEDSTVALLGAGGRRRRVRDLLGAHLHA